MTVSTDKVVGRRGALGKGFNSLLGDIEPAPSVAATTPTEGFMRLRVADIDPNPHQPRKLFDSEALEGLAKSLKEDGLLEPILVSKSETAGRYTLVAGERRWRAAQLAGLETLPALIREIAPHDLLRIALLENIQRADLNAIEEAEAFASLIKDFGLTQEQCAARLGKERSTVANSLRLLALPREIQDDVIDGRLTMGHGRAILSLDDQKMMLRARDIVIKKQLSVRQTEQLCKTIKESGAADDQKKETEKAQADLDYIAESLRSHLRTKVRVAGTGSRGKIEISYFSNAELERILSIIGPRF